MSLRSEPTLREAAGVARRRLLLLIETVEGECDSPSVDVCHDHDRTEDGRCALAADLNSIETDLRAALAQTQQGSVEAPW